jgi:hypothetical protein
MPTGLKCFGGGPRNPFLVSRYYAVKEMGEVFGGKSMKTGQI